MKAAPRWGRCWQPLLSVLAGWSFCTGLAPAAGPSLVLPPGVPVVVDPEEPGSVRRAAEDLCRDLQAVLGQPSPRVSRLPQDENLAAIVVAGTAPGTAALRDPAVTGPEAHAVFLRGNRVVLQGADPRGAIYAIYSFSDRFLDVPPWWVFAEWRPPVRASVALPRDTHLRWGSPQVAWRAWFPNDQDLLTPWIQEDYENRWNLLAETMLRLKLNLVDIGELTGKSTRKAEIPRDRGLAVTTTHMAPFGASFRNWDKFWAARGEPVPALSLEDPESLETFWEEHIRLVLSKKLEMLWMIGFRGDGDKGFHRTFAGAPEDAAGRARVVGDMLRRQVALLKRVTGQEHPLMRTVLYDECSDYLAAGLLEPPREPALIWNYVNARRDHFPAPDLLGSRIPAGRLTGYYFNAQFTETGSHLADGEGPWKMEQNYRMARDAGGRLVFSIINAGNVREFPLTLAAHARMMWDFEAYESGRFLEEFCQRYWGVSSGTAVARLYRDYFEAYWQPRRPDLPGFSRQYLFQDLRLARAARELLKATGDPEEEADLLADRVTGYYRIVPQDSGAASRVDAVITGCGVAAARFQAVAEQTTALASQLQGPGRPFLEHGLGRQAAFMAAASRSAATAGLAAQEVRQPEKYLERMRELQSALLDMKQALATPASDRFPGWYEPEAIFKLEETRGMVERRLKGMIPKPASRRE